MEHNINNITIRQFYITNISRFLHDYQKQKINQQEVKTNFIYIINVVCNKTKHKIVVIMISTLL